VEKEEDNTTEIWYVWIDVETNINGEATRVVSKSPVKITCCVKSPKYRKYVKKAEKWFQKNIDGDFHGETVINKIQDFTLAMDMIAKASEVETAGLKLMQVDFEEPCK